LFPESGKKPTRLAVPRAPAPPPPVFLGDAVRRRDLLHARAQEAARSRGGDGLAQGEHSVVDARHRPAEVGHHRRIRLHRFGKRGVPVGVEPQGRDQATSKS
jgi:hypothetical protein